MLSNRKICVKLRKLCPREQGVLTSHLFACMMSYREVLLLTMDSICSWQVILCADIMKKFKNVGTRDTLVNRVYDQIQKMIMEGGLAPGTMLPPERELCEQFGVSRTALREAVRMLASKGLLETRPGVGTFVTQVSKDGIKEHIGILLNQGGGVTLENINQARQILEIEIAGIAAHEATPEDIRLLDKLVQEMESAKDKPKEFAAKESAFHAFLSEVTHNPLLVILLDTMSTLNQEVIRLLRAHPDWSQALLADHSRIVNAIQDRDSGQAAHAMQLHLTNICRMAEEALVQRDGSSKANFFSNQTV